MKAAIVLICCLAFSPLGAAGVNGQKQEERSAQSIAASPILVDLNLPEPEAAELSTEEHWTQLPLTGKQVNCLAIDPVNSQVLYAGTSYYGVWKSNDGGASWVASSSGLTDSYVYSLAIDPSNPQILYAGTGYPGVFKSSNGGASWIASSSGLSGNSVSCLAIDPIYFQTLYAGGGGVWKSTNRGTSWTDSSSGITSSGVCLAIDPNNSQTLYTGTGDGLVKSNDGGRSWTDSSSGLTDSTVLCLAVDPNNSQTLYAGTPNGGIFKSSNGGESWAVFSSGIVSSGVWSLAIDPNNSQTLYAGSDSGKAWKSSDGGASWTAFSNGLPNNVVYCLAIDPNNSQTLYAGTNGNGVFKWNPGTPCLYFSPTTKITPTGPFDWDLYLDGGVPFYLVEFHLAFQPSTLQGISFSYNPLFTVPGQDSWDNTNGIYDFARSTGTATYIGPWPVKIGTFHWNALVNTPTAGTTVHFTSAKYVGDDFSEIPLSTQDSTLVIRPLAGVLSGTIALAGRSSNARVGIRLVVNASPLLTTLTDSTGYYRLENVPVGSPSLKIYRAAYLTGTASFTMDNGQTVVISGTLLGGDGNDDGQVSGTDLALVGANYNKSSTPTFAPQSGKVQNPNGTPLLVPYSTGNSSSYFPLATKTTPAEPFNWDLSLGSGTLTGTIALAGRLSSDRAGIRLVVDSSPLLTTLTDSSGAYRLENVPVGSHSLKIFRAAYLTGTASFTLASGQTVVVSGTLLGGDGNDDGQVSGTDLALVGVNFNKSSTPTFTPQREMARELYRTTLSVPRSTGTSSLYLSPAVKTTPTGPFNWDLYLDGGAPFYLVEFHLAFQPSTIQGISFSYNPLFTVPGQDSWDNTTGIYDFARSTGTATYNGPWPVKIGTFHWNALVNTPTTGTTIHFTAAKYVGDDFLEYPLQMGDGFLYVVTPTPPRIAFTPSAFTFSCTRGQAIPPPQTLEVWNSGEGIMDWTASGDSTWLSLSPTTGSSTGEYDLITLSVDGASLSTGTYTTTITLASIGADNTPQKVGVTLDVHEPLPSIACNPSSFTFSCTRGQVIPPPQTLEVWNSGGGTLNWTANEYTGWLSLSPTSNSSTGEHNSITLFVDASSLTTGTYTATITLAAVGADDSPQEIPVSLTVEPQPPVIGFAPSLFTFTATAGEVNPVDQILTLWNDGEAPLNWTVAKLEDWLTLLPTRGSDAGSVAVGVDTTGLVADTYSATITITAPDAINSPQQIPVTLTVAPAIITLDLDLVSGWNMVSIPLVLADAHPDAVFPAGWPLFLWDAVQGSYKGRSQITLAIGVGYWLKAPLAQPLPVQGLVNPSALQLIPFWTGWNLIGVPCHQPVGWSSIHVRKASEVKTLDDAILAGWIKEPFYRWTGSAYESITSGGTFQPTSGYWLKGLQEGCELEVTKP